MVFMFYYLGNVIKSIWIKIYENWIRIKIIIEIKGKSLG